MANLGQSAGLNSSRIVGKVVFLRNEELWFCDRNGKQPEQLFTFPQKIRDYLFSPDLRYLAYSTPDTDIVIWDLEKNQQMKVVHPDAFWHFSLNKWISRERLIFCSASGGGMGDIYAVDVSKGVKEDLGVEGYVLLDANFSSDYSSELYVTDTGLGKDYLQHLHLLDLGSGKDAVLCSKRSILNPVISPNEDVVAFVEVEWGKQHRDHYLLYHLSSGAIEEYYVGASEAKPGGLNQISWSPDGRKIGFFFLPEGLVFDLGRPRVPKKVEGIGLDTIWIDNDHLMWTRGTGLSWDRRNQLYIHDLKLGATTLFLNDAAKPFYVLTELQ